MKIRQGFVSNSSSSSFVVFGYNLTEAQLDEAGVLPDELPDGIGYLYSDSGYLVGKILADAGSENGDCLEDRKIPISEIMDCSEFIRNLFKQEENPSLLLGTRSC